MEESEPFAIVDDLEARWRPLSDSEKARAEVLLDDGSRYIRAAVGGEPENLPLAQTVLCSMVKRALMSPIDQAPLKSYQQMAGPFQEMQTFQNPSGDLYLTGNEKKLLGIGSGRFGSLRPAIHDRRGGDIDGW